jgi:hypothetical protein
MVKSWTTSRQALFGARMRKRLLLILSARIFDSSVERGIPSRAAAPEGQSADMFRRMYWDTAVSASDPVLRMLRDVAGITHVLFGTDFPHQRRDLAARSKQVLQGAALNDLECGAILGGNASRLLPRLRSVLAES